MAVTAIGELGTMAPDFALPGIDGRTWRRDELMGPNGLLVMFICNHCPYVKAIADRIARDARDLAPIGVGVVAINANDWTAYPDDAPDKMAAFARAHHFGFAYLIDESQAVAKAYGALCTPDFFGYDAHGTLRYRGRLDASRASPAPADARRELYEAMTLIAETGKGPDEQIPSMGCSIKWKPGNAP